MERKSSKPWRLEVNNPVASVDEWRTIFEFNDEQLVPFQELRDELNEINTPVQLRIVRNSTE